MLASVALAKLALHLVLSGRYGLLDRRSLIAVNIPEEYLKPWFERVETRATVECDYCMPDRMRMPITVCRGLEVPLREFWPNVKC